MNTQKEQQTIESEEKVMFTDYECIKNILMSFMLFGAIESLMNKVVIILMGVF